VPFSRVVACGPRLKRSMVTVEFQVHTPSALRIDSPRSNFEILYCNLECFREVVTSDPIRFVDREGADKVFVGNSDGFHRGIGLGSDNDLIGRWEVTWKIKVHSPSGGDVHAFGRDCRTRGGDNECVLILGTSEPVVLVHCAWAREVTMWDRHCTRGIATIADGNGVSWPVTVELEFHAPSQVLVSPPCRYRCAADRDGKRVPVLVSTQPVLAVHGALTLQTAHGNRDRLGA